MIIVLEGPDGVGKTTLADAIEATIGSNCRRVRSGPPTPDVPVIEQLWDAMTDIPTDHHHTIVDRFHVGELVYGPIMRGSSRLSIEEASLIDMNLMGMGATLVHCTLARKDHKARLVSRDGGAPDPKSGAALGHMDAIRIGFSSAVKRLPGRWLQLDMNGYPTQLAATVLERANTRVATPWIGSREPSVIAVVPDDVGLGDLAWMVGQFRESGFISDLAVFRESDRGMLPDQREVHAIVDLTEGSYWEHAAEWPDDIRDEVKRAMSHGAGEANGL